MDRDIVDFAEARRDGIDGNWLDYDHAGRIPLSEEAVAQAREFLFDRWCAMAEERGQPRPGDLSNACKFGTLFVKAVFGGTISGNYDHLHAVVDGGIVDLQAGAADVVVLSEPYRVDEDFLWSDDLAFSFGTCLRRVEGWTDEFVALANAPKP